MESLDYCILAMYGESEGTYHIIAEFFGCPAKYGESDRAYHKIGESFGCPTS